jgi:hypothetical protein
MRIIFLCLFLSGCSVNWVWCRDSTCTGFDMQAEEEVGDLAPKLGVGQSDKPEPRDD